MRHNAVISSDAAISVLTKLNSKSHPKRPLYVWIQYALRCCYSTVVSECARRAKLNCSMVLGRKKYV